MCLDIYTRDRLTTHLYLLESELHRKIKRGGDTKQFSLSPCQWLHIETNGENVKPSTSFTKNLARLFMVHFGVIFLIRCIFKLFLINIHYKCVEGAAASLSKQKLAQ